VRRIGADRISVCDWNCELQTAVSVPDTVTHVGVRSHQLMFMPADNQENTFLCWLVSTSEAPHEMTVYLRLHDAPQTGEPAHLQADVPKDYWRTLSAQPQPWRVQLHPERLLLLNG
jgi:ABC-type sulfate/molybdate transport systems ATPase subunit